MDFNTTEITLSLARAQVHWWLMAFPCVLLGLTLMALNFLGDALRARVDPRARRR